MIKTLALKIVAITKLDVSFLLSAVTITTCALLILAIKQKDVSMHLLYVMIMMFVLMIAVIHLKDALLSEDLFHLEINVPLQDVIPKLELYLTRLFVTITTLVPLILVILLLDVFIAL
jgi:hypothetical protein